MSRWKRNSVGTTAPMGRRGEGEGKNKGKCKARVKSGPQGQDNPGVRGVRAYQVVVYESIMDVSLHGRIE